MAVHGSFPPEEQRPRRDFAVMTTNVVLLEQTKQYLEAQLRRQAPNTVLAQAWDEFYRVYSNLIRRFVQAQGLRGADADDCVQEVWSTVALKLAEFERPQQRPGLRSWLYTVVRSKTTDYLRRSRCRPARSLDQAVDQGHEPVGREPDPAVVWEHQWQQALIRTAMDELRQQLPDESFRVLQMRLLEGRSEAETAAALNLTVEQVHSRKYRAQQKLQSLVAVYTGQDSE